MYWRIAAKPVALDVDRSRTCGSASNRRWAGLSRAYRYEKRERTGYITVEEKRSLTELEDHSCSKPIKKNERGEKNSDPSLLKNINEILVLEIC